MARNDNPNVHYDLQNVSDETEVDESAEQDEKKIVKALMAKLLGQPGFDFVVNLKQAWRPDKAVLIPECQRRAEMLGVDMLKAPSRAKHDELVQWLKKRPITAQDEIRSLISQLPPEIREKWSSENADDGNHGVNQQGDEEKIVMAEALGLLGCDYAEPPFTVNTLYEPTKAMLFDEVKRRKKIRKLECNRQDKWKIPNIQWGKESIAAWLREYPIPSGDEAEELKRRVAAFKEMLSPCCIDTKPEKLDNNPSPPPSVVEPSDLKKAACTNNLPANLGAQGLPQEGHQIGSEGRTEEQLLEECKRTAAALEISWPDVLCILRAFLLSLEAQESDVSCSSFEHYSAYPDSRTATDNGTSKTVQLTEPSCFRDCMKENSGNISLESNSVSTPADSNVMSFEDNSSQFDSLLMNAEIKSFGSDDVIGAPSRADNGLGGHEDTGACTTRRKKETTPSEVFGSGKRSDESMSEVTRMSEGSSDSTLSTKKTRRADGDFMNICDIDPATMAHSSQKGLDSMDDVSSAAGSSISVSTFGGSNDRSIGCSLCSNPSTPHSSTSTASPAEASNSNGSTLCSSQDDSGLTASSKKQLRIQGAGPLSPLLEDMPAPDSVAFGGDGIVDPNGSHTLPDDDMSLITSAVASVDGDGARKVKDMDLYDNENRPGKYSGTVSGSDLVPHGTGKMMYENGMVYDGQWKEGHWEGHGVLNYADEDSYKGKFAKGYFWGSGHRQWPDGSRYEGEWKLGQRSGSGIFHSSAGDSTEGKWLEDKLRCGRIVFRDGAHYEGILVEFSLHEDAIFVGDWSNSKYTSSKGEKYDTLWAYTDGSKFEGLFFRGDDSLYRNGREYRGHWSRDQTLPDGSTYEGMLNVDGTRTSGFGERTNRNGDKYKGCFVNQKEEGLGKYRWSDGREYVGDLKNGVMQGRGRLSHPDGSKYEGEFHHGVAHGQGRFTDANGTYEGSFVNGKREKHGKYSSSDGRVYEGEWHDDKRNGKGKCIHPDRSYEGSFVNDKQEGFGKCVWSYGREYEGEWKNDKKHGRGKQTDPTGGKREGCLGKGWAEYKRPTGQEMAGEVYEGEFRHGKKHGLGRISYTTGASYEGGFRNDLWHGQGCFVNADGSKFHKGEWEDDEPVQHNG